MNKRTLDDDFEKDLRFGILHELLEYVQNDDTLMLATRGTHINIYYRGGSILKIERNTSGKVYTATFDSSYAKGTPLPSLPQILTSADDVRTWLEALPCLKHIMDVYLYKIKRNYEREIQQYIVRENNDSPSSQKTDYFVTDIEIAENEQINCRFDMLAFCWERSKRARSRKMSLAFVEVKYGVESLKGKSGIVAHFQQYVDLVENVKLNDLYESSQEQFNQLVRLGIFNHNAMVEGFQVKVFWEQPELIFIFASDNIYSDKLDNELYRLKNLPAFTKHKDKVKFYIGIAGYVLYRKCLCNLEDFMLHRKCLRKLDDCMSKLRGIEEEG